MKEIKPKLLPTLLCLIVVGLTAAFLPYPGFNNGVTVLESDFTEAGRTAK